MSISCFLGISELTYIYIYIYIYIFFFIFSLIKTFGMYNNISHTNTYGNCQNRVTKHAAISLRACQKY